MGNRERDFLTLLFLGGYAVCISSKMKNHADMKNLSNVFF